MKYLISTEVQILNCNKWYFKDIGEGDVDWNNFLFVSSCEFGDKSVYSTKDGSLAEDSQLVRTGVSL